MGGRRVTRKRPLMPAFQWMVFDADLEPVIGSEQGGRRPVLVVSDEDFNQTMPNATVLPLTSTQRKLYPSEVILPGGVAGQPLTSIVLAHQIRTISKRRFGRAYGMLNDAQIRDAILDAMREHLNLE